MGPLLLLLASMVLLVGFVALTIVERRRGSRVGAAWRIALDTHLERLQFIVAHVDLAAFVRDSLRDLIERALHQIATFSLQAVRALERLLTRIVRFFRIREATSEPRESTRAFVKTLSDFKEQLKATEPTELQDL